MRLLLHGGPRTAAVPELARHSQGAVWLVPTGEAAGRARAAAAAAGKRPAFVGTFGEWAFRLLGTAPMTQEARRRALDAAMPSALRDATERLRLSTRAVLSTPFPGGREGADVLLDALAFQKGDEWRDSPHFPALFPDALPARGALEVVALAYDATKRPQQDEADALLDLRRRLRAEADWRARTAEEAGTVLVSDLEETTHLERTMLQALAPANLVMQGEAFAHTGRRGPPFDPPAEMLRLFPDLKVQEVHANRETAAQVVRVLRAVVPDLQDTAPGGGSAIRTANFPTLEAEARYVAAGVGGLVQQRTPPGTIAVVHPHEAPPPALVDALSRARAPLTRLAGQGDPKGNTAEALWSYLRWVTDPSFQYKRTDLQHQAVLASLLAMHTGVSREAAMRFVRALGTEGPSTAAAQAVASALRKVKDPAVDRAVQGLLQHRQEMRTRLSSLTPAMAMREARTYLAREGVRPPTEPEWDFALVTTVEGEAKAHENVATLVEDLRRWRDGQAVAVIPAARAKALLFDHVFFAGFTEGEFPQAEEGPVFERDARRFAAGASAARKALTITSGGTPSRFYRDAFAAVQRGV